MKLFKRELIELRLAWTKLVLQHAHYEEEDYDTLLYFYHSNYPKLEGTRLEREICTLLDDIGECLGFLNGDYEAYESELDYFMAKGNEYNGETD